MECSYICIITYFHIYSSPDIKKYSMCKLMSDLVAAQRDLAAAQRDPVAAQRDPVAAQHDPVAVQRHLAVGVFPSAELKKNKKPSVLDRCKHAQ